MKVCEKCNNEITVNYGTGRFCSSKCAHSFSTTNDNGGTKLGKCVECGSDIEVDKRSSLKKVKCKICLLKYYTRYYYNNTKKNCIICGDLKCIRPDICRKGKLFESLIKYFGLNKLKLGTIEIYEEYERICNIVKEDYYDKEMSILMLIEKFKYPNNTGNFIKILRSLGVESRTISQSNAIYLLSDRFKPIVRDNSIYKSGYHTTWNGSKIYYRSSYELEYAKELDVLQVQYKVENLRLIYWDSQLHKQRIAIPDFYLPETNTIVEIKSSWTYDEQNMKDKFKSYKEHGYNTKLVLNKLEIEL